MKYIRFISVFIITLFAIISANAQDETIRVETDLVTVNVAVTDKQGKPVKNLRHLFVFCRAFGGIRPTAKV